MKNPKPAAVINGTVLKIPNAKINKPAKAREKLSTLTYLDLIPKKPIKRLDTSIPLAHIVSAIPRVLASEIDKIENCINADTPIIALTANAIVGVKDEYLKAGFNDYITKPIRPKKLESMIVQYLPKELVLEKDAVIEINEEQNEDLPSVNGVSWNVALEYLFDKELLLETLNDFVTEGKDNGEKLKKLLLDLKASGDDNREEAFKNYCIQAHAMKSNAKMIGAIAISEMAKWLEFLAKDKKFDEIIAMNDLFLEKWNELIEELSIKFNISY